MRYLGFISRVAWIVYHPSLLMSDNLGIFYIYKLYLINIKEKHVSSYWHVLFKLLLSSFGVMVCFNLTDSCRSYWIISSRGAGSEWFWICFPLVVYQWITVKGFQRLFSVCKQVFALFSSGKKVHTFVSKAIEDSKSTRINLKNK